MVIYLFRKIKNSICLFVCLKSLKPQKIILNGLLIYLKTLKNIYLLIHSFKKIKTKENNFKWLLIYLFKMFKNNMNLFILNA